MTVNWNLDLQRNAFLLHDLLATATSVHFCLLSIEQRCKDREPFFIQQTNARGYK